VIELEKAAQATSEICDDYMDNKNATATDIKLMRDKMSKLEDANFKLYEENNDINERFLETQSRMMEQNLLFFGIAETTTSRENPREDTAGVLRDFMKDQLEFKGDTKPEDIVFARVHRLGRKMFDNSGKQLRPRPIVAKFDMMSQREIVRLSANSLFNSTFSIREQFPTEIEERRKRLYPVMRRAKDDGQNAHLVRDKLFVNGQLITNSRDYAGRDYSSQQPNYDHRRDRRVPPYNSSNRQVDMISPRPRREVLSWRGATSSNRFGGMNDGDPMPTESGHDPSGIVRSKKSKATSPLDQQSVKKSRDEHTIQALAPSNIVNQAIATTSTAQTRVPANSERVTSDPSGDSLAGDRVGSGDGHVTSTD
jgi:hypothetical protein